MENNSFSNAVRGGSTNSAIIGESAQVGQIAVGTGITQIQGYTAEQVRVLIAQISSSFQKKPFDGRSPYVGLASFQEQDADRFFGRETLTQALVKRIAQTRFLIIAGPSGSGKSSLARAGLIHALKTGALDDSENWLYEILTPGRHPLDALGRVIDNLKDLNAGDDLRKQGRTDETRLSRWLEAALGDQRARRAILLVDQFEETFTQVTDADERAAFLNLLTYAATQADGRVIIVVCTRSDFIGNWAAYPKLNAQLGNGINQIPPMQDDELVSAIARPALQVGLQIDPDLVKQILDDMRDAPGALPLMQFALDDLFEYEKSKGGVIALTRDDYLERGGLQKALARHADAEFAKLNADEQQMARVIFSRLIEPGRGSVDTKRTALFSELMPSGADAEQVKTVVTKLADARLVTTDKINERETVTLAHERLIDAWGWLRRLVDENREAIALQNQINEDAQEWEQHGRDASYLYTGTRLATAQEQVHDKKIQLSALAQEFVDAGIRARKAARRSRQRQKSVALAAGTAFIVLLILIGYEPIRREVLRQQALSPNPIYIPQSEAKFGDLRGGSDITHFLPANTQTIAAFSIEPYEVTNSRYMLCIEATRCSPPIAFKSTFEGPENANLPVVNVTAIQANQFCEWLGRALPTELEWERAARGTHGRNWPKELPEAPTDGNLFYGVLPFPALKPVGSIASDISPDKVFDMAGNAREWTRSAYDWNLKDWTGSEDSLPTSLAAKGGSRKTTTSDMENTIAYRAATAPFAFFDHTGFRCVAH